MWSVDLTSRTERSQFLWGLITVCRPLKRDVRSAWSSIPSWADWMLVLRYYLQSDQFVLLSLLMSRRRVFIFSGAICGLYRTVVLDKAILCSRQLVVWFWIAFFTRSLLDLARALCCKLRVEPLFFCFPAGTRAVPRVLKQTTKRLWRLEWSVDLLCEGSEAVASGVLSRTVDRFGGRASEWSFYGRPNRPGPHVLIVSVFCTHLIDVSR